jgi:hypothetical protein
VAQITLNKAQWDAVPPEEQQRIIAGLKTTGALQQDDNIDVSAEAPMFTENSVIEPMWNPIKDLCKVACDTAAAAGVAWCTANTAGIGLAACVAAAEAARRACRDRC